VNPLLAPLANYGGPTLTHMLFEGSPALDKGNVAGLGLTNDQRGFARVVDVGGIANAADGDGSDIGAVEGSVSAPLEITQHPQSLTVRQGQSATFSVLVLGTPLGYQWRKDGANISGANSATFTIASAQPADAGLYSVVVSNAVSTHTSSNAALTIIVPPTILEQPHSFSLPVGFRGCTEVTATGAEPLAYQWRKDGVAIPGATTRELKFDSLAVTNTGNYDVVVSDAGGSVTSLVAVATVLVPPVITQQPQPVTITNGQNAVLTVAADGTAPLQYQWRRNGVPVPGATGTTFTINAAQPFQAGIYDVVVANLVGSALSAPAALTVNYAVKQQSVFGGTARDVVRALIRTSDGGYLIGGYSASDVSGNKEKPAFGGGDAWVLKLDARLNKAWEMVYGGVSLDSCVSVAEAVGGGYFLGISSESGVGGNKTTPNYGGQDYWIVKVDANGGKVWEQNYGGSTNDVLYAVVGTADGGCIVGGYSMSPASGNKTNEPFNANHDYWVLKLDGAGNKQWERTFGGDLHDLLVDLKQTSDGGYILSGESNVSGGGNKSTNGFGTSGSDYYVVRLDAAGNKLWDRVYGGTNTDQSPLLVPTADGGYLLYGKSFSGISGNKSTPAFGFYDIWLVRINANGDILWDKTIGTADQETPESMAATSDGGYVLTYTSQSGDIRTLKLDSNGNTQWQRDVGGSLSESGSQIAIAPDGDVVMACLSDSPTSGDKKLNGFGDFDIWVAKYNQTSVFADAAVVFLEVPENLVVRTGATVAITPVVDNYPTSYTWRKNGSVISNTPSLYFTNVSSFHAATYTLTISNLLGAVTSPNITLAVISDTDGDGLPDDWEAANGTNPNVADANADPDGDGFTNLQEYLAGTAANSSVSRLELAVLPVVCDNLAFGFNAVSNLTYTIQSTTDIGSGNWTRVLDILAAPTNRVIILNEDPRGQPGRFLRLVTPMRP